MKGLIRILRALGWLPWRVRHALGALVGLLFYVISAERRGVALTNLRLCFPELSESERRRLARRHFKVFAQSLLDRSLLWWGSTQRLERRLWWVDRHHFDDAVKRAPVIILAPHFVGLDAGGTLISFDWRVVSMYSAQKDPALDAAILSGRSRFNAPVLLSRQDGVRGAVRALKEGIPFYYLPDMDFGARDATFVPFFGIPAATITTMARLARLTNALVVPCITRMTPSGYELRAYPAWDDFPGEDLEAATARMNRFIEDRVREMPEQYLWTHRRFKTRPPGEPSLYPPER